MQISSISPINDYSINSTQSVAQLQKQIVDLQKQINVEEQSKTDSADQKQKKILLLQQQVQLYQVQLQKLTNSSVKSV